MCWFVVCSPQVWLNGNHHDFRSPTRDRFPLDHGMDALIRHPGKPADGLVAGEELLYLLPPAAENLEDPDNNTNTLSYLVRVAQVQSGGNGDIDSAGGRKQERHMEADRGGRGRREFADAMRRGGREVEKLELESKERGRGRGGPVSESWSDSFRFPPSPPTIQSSSPTASPLRKLIRGPASAAWEWWNKHSKAKTGNSQLLGAPGEAEPKREEYKKGRRTDLPEETKPRRPKGGLRTSKTQRRREVEDA